MAKELSSSSPTGLSSRRKGSIFQWSVPSTSHGFGLSCCGGRVRAQAFAHPFASAGGARCLAEGDLWKCGVGVAILTQRGGGSPRQCCSLAVLGAPSPSSVGAAALGHPARLPPCVVLFSFACTLKQLRLLVASADEAAGWSSRTRTNRVSSSRKSLT